MTQVVVIIVRALPELLITIEGPDISTIQIFSFPNTLQEWSPWSSPSTIRMIVVAFVGLSLRFVCCTTSSH